MTAEHLLPVIRASPNLIDLNLRYAENVEAKTIAKEELKKLKYINVLEVGKDSGRAVKLLEGIGADFYYEDEPFHTKSN